MYQYVNRMLIAVLVSAFCACANMPVANQKHIIHQPYDTVNTGAFTHKVWRNKIHRGSKRLHVYIGGDGMPWLGRRKIALDPTPSYSLAWDLMQGDTHAAVFINRPCYYDTQGITNTVCTPYYWTSARYSKTVVESLADVIQKEALYSGASELWIIGFSGGGALAILIAANLKPANLIKGVVTVSANLDTHTWTTHHHYSPLTQSLNPADLPRMALLKQYHFVGEKDLNTPMHLNSRFYETQNITPIIVPKHNHSSGWRELWPSLLSATLNREYPLRKTKMP